MLFHGKHIDHLLLLEAFNVSTGAKALLLSRDFFEERERERETGGSKQFVKLSYHKYVDFLHANFQVSNL